MKFLTVSVYDAEYLIINEMANCHKYTSPLLIIVQKELITFDKEAHLD
jgi:hypothetical protein